MDSKKKFCSTQFYAFQLKLDTVILLGVFIGKTVKEMQMRPKMRPDFVSYLSNGLHICLDRNLNSQAQKTLFDFNFFSTSPWENKQS